MLLTSHLAFGGVQDNRTGESIYRRGELTATAPLRGNRDEGDTVQGARAACVNCHRPSGLGTSEGSVIVPPIIGKYLFRPHLTNVQDMSLSHVSGYRSTREPYTDETLARAIRAGVDPSGRTLSYLMPRYPIDDSSMASLTSYLKGLGSLPARGVGADTLHFATIITPDTDPIKRQAMLDVMARFFADKNEFIRGGVRPMQSSREIEYRVSRRWQLHVWQLNGEPDQWEQQLRAHLAAEPVFAVISGLGGRTWAPVHHFCEAEKLPCLFPNVDLPVVAEDDFYPVYFSRGVLLEVDLMAQGLFAQSASLTDTYRIARLVQVYREGDVGESASKALAALAMASGVKVENRSLRPEVTDRHDMALALSDLGPDDALVLWLRPADIQKLGSVAPTTTRVFVSGIMAGLENAPFPEAWRTLARLTYPVDLPALRKVRMNFPQSWLKINHLPIVDERIQSDTYVACGILAETLTGMLDSFVPEYLIERVETMVSHRLVNAYYPRLSLAPGQRFGSKGGYLVRFDMQEKAGNMQKVVAVSEWTVP
jgi:hypothetical protein